MKLSRAIATVGGLTMLSRLAGFARDVLAAAILGAGPANDAFVVALKLPNLFRRLFAEGAFHVSFVPLFAGAVQTEGRTEAIKFAEQALAALLTALIPLTILALIFMPALMPLIAPGFQHDSLRFELTVYLSRITFPYLLLISIVALMGGMLNALGKFGPFAEGPILFNACLILGLVLAWAFPHTVAAAPAMAWSVTLAGVAQLLWLLRAIHQEGIRLRLIRPTLTPRVKRLLVLMTPGALGAGAMQINILIDLLFASFLPVGSVSYLYYADRLNQLPLGVIGVAIGTTLLPVLSRQVKAGNIEAVHNAVSRALEFALLLTLPAAVALIAIAHPIIASLFQHGNFSAADAQATAQALIAYAAGVPAYVLAKVFSTAFFAREDTASPVKITLFTTAVNTVLAALLFWPLAHIGLALATSIAGWLQVVLLVTKLYRRGYLVLDERLRYRGIRLILASVVMGIVLWLAAWPFTFAFTASLPVRALVLGGIMTLGTLVYFGVGQLTGALRLQDLPLLLKRDKAADTSEATSQANVNF